jgi:beta-lactamase regulating signal transducer with metallopeptidase domain
VLPAQLALSPLRGAVVLALCLIVIMLLCYRWARLAPFYRSVYETREADAGQFSATFRVFDELTEQAWGGGSWLPRPRLMVIQDAASPAFTMGMRPPIIVLSADVARELPERELKAILAHELAHVRRFDYFARWLASILRDIMIWNPFALNWYARLASEQETASDEYAADLLNDPAGVASGLVEIAAHALDRSMVSVGPLSAWHANRSTRRLEERVDHLERYLDLPAKRVSWSAAILYGALAVFAAVQPTVSLCFPTIYLSLR